MSRFQVWHDRAMDEDAGVEIVAPAASHAAYRYAKRDLANGYCAESLTVCAREVDSEGVARFVVTATVEFSVAHVLDLAVAS